MERFKKIISLNNPEIKSVYKLRNSKERYKQNKFIAEGERICSTLIDFQIRLIKIYLVEKNLNNTPKNFPKEKITVIPEKLMKKLSQASTPSGILGVFEIPEKKSKITSGIVLAEISDPGNMGTLIRTAAAMDLKSVIIVGGVDPWSFKVIQSTAGNIALTNIFQWNWQELLENKNGFKLIALVVKNGKKITKQENFLLVIGNEAHGLPKKWLNDCDQLITLDMPGPVESLNASVAGSIAMYFLKVKV